MKYRKCKPTTINHYFEFTLEEVTLLLKDHIRRKWPQYNDLSFSKAWAVFHDETLVGRPSYMSLRVEESLKEKQ